MDGRIGFDYHTFKILFPSLATETEARLQMLWDTACTIVSNPNPVICSESTLKRVLLYLVAHLITLDNRGADTAGRISSATEGSVSVGFEALPIKSMDEAWWAQTQYGMTAWRITSPYRGATLVKGDDDCPFGWH